MIVAVVVSFYYWRKHGKQDERKKVRRERQEKAIAESPFDSIVFTQDKLDLDDWSADAGIYQNPIAETELVPLSPRFRKPSDNAAPDVVRSLDSLEKVNGDNGIIAGASGPTHGNLSYSIPATGLTKTEGRAQLAILRGQRESGEIQLTKLIIKIRNSCL